MARAVDPAEVQQTVSSLGKDVGVKDILILGGTYLFWLSSVTPAQSSGFTGLDSVKSRKDGREEVAGESRQGFVGAQCTDRKSVWPFLHVGE